jgi:hypothetical protein
MRQAITACPFRRHGPSRSPRQLRSHSRALAHSAIYAPDVTEERSHGLDPQVATRLAEVFSARVLELGNLPPARADDLRASCELGSTDNGSVLRLTCTITGTTHESAWDGSEGTAISLVEDAAEDTAFLVTRTPHYAWLRSAR